MLAIGQNRVTNSISARNSMKAGKNIRRISMGAVAIIIMIEVRFGIIKIF